MQLLSVPPTSVNATTRSSSMAASASHPTRGYSRPKNPTASSPAALQTTEWTACCARCSLSGGAIGGIVAAIIIVGLLVVLFLVRKMSLRKRQQKRVTWGGSIYPQNDSAPETSYYNEKSAAEIPPPVLEKRMSAGAPPSHEVIASFPTPPPPPMSYNNPPPPSPPTSSVPLVSPPPVPVIQAPVPTLQPALGSPAVTLTPAPVDIAYAYVRCTFIPTLPDELSITTGELVRILGEFDMAGLCARTRVVNRVSCLSNVSTGASFVRAGPVIWVKELETGGCREGPAVCTLQAPKVPPRCVPRQVKSVSLLEPTISQMF